ncbi:UNVERIFIED_CONTAM: Protein CHROMATIN REMODELING 20 [Sesamum indicum]
MDAAEERAEDEEEIAHADNACSDDSLEEEGGEDEEEENEKLCSEKGRSSGTDNPVIGSPEEDFFVSSDLNHLTEPLTEEEIEVLISELLEVESKAAEAQEALEEESLMKVEADVRKELALSLSDNELEKAVVEEMFTFKEEWEVELDELETESAYLLERQERLKSLEAQCSTKSVMMNSMANNGISLDGAGHEVLGDTSSGYIINLVREEGEDAIAGIRFMWENIIQSVRKVRSGDKGLGCILAHTMGLGKTFQVIAFLYTAMRCVDLGLKTALIVMPVSVLHNWRLEFMKWRPSELKPLRIFMLEDVPRDKRVELLSKWRTKGGVFLIGYAAFRNLSLGKYVKDQNMAKEISHALKVGPDILVCDEAHIIKNTKADTTQALKQVKCQRRIALTGSPLQNNLMEYYCLKGFVQRTDTSVVKKDLPPKTVFVIAVKLSPLQRELYKRFLDVHGFTKDKASGEKIFKRSFFAGYQALAQIWNHPGILQLMKENKDCGKFEDVENCLPDDSSSDENLDYNLISGENMSLIYRQCKVQLSLLLVVFQPAQCIWECCPNDKGNIILKDFAYMLACISNGLWFRLYCSAKCCLQRSGAILTENLDWWREFLQDNTYKEVNYSGKMVLLLDILTMCSYMGDKALVFSQSLLTLDLIEFYLSKLPRPAKNGKCWKKRKDWYRLDGRTESSERQKLVERFNDPLNRRVKCTLISTRAGSLGINLHAANRVIIVDGSWNPTYDLQAIFRVWRYGQTKPVFAYRLLAHGTMEEKIYKRQVTKEGLAARVVDRQQVHRTMSKEEILHLFEFGDDEKADVMDELGQEQEVVAKPNTGNLLKPELPHPQGTSSDNLFEMLISRHHLSWISNYHEHDTLLQENEDEKLSKEEQDLAWELYLRTLKWEESKRVHPDETILDQPKISVDASASRQQHRLVATTAVNQKPVPPVPESDALARASHHHQNHFVQRKCTNLSHLLTLRSQGTKMGCSTICGECAQEIRWEDNGKLVK